MKAGRQLHESNSGRLKTAEFGFFIRQPPYGCGRTGNPLRGSYGSDCRRCVPKVDVSTAALLRQPLLGAHRNSAISASHGASPQDGCVRQPSLFRSAFPIAFCKVLQHAERARAPGTCNSPSSPRRRNLTICCTRLRHIAVICNPLQTFPEMSGFWCATYISTCMWPLSVPAEGICRITLHRIPSGFSPFYRCWFYVFPFHQHLHNMTPTLLH